MKNKRTNLYRVSQKTMRRLKKLAKSKGCDVIRKVSGIAIVNPLGSILPTMTVKNTELWLKRVNL